MNQIHLIHHGQVSTWDLSRPKTVPGFSGVVASSGWMPRHGHDLEVYRAECPRIAPRAQVYLSPEIWRVNADHAVDEAFEADTPPEALRHDQQGRTWSRVGGVAGWDGIPTAAVSLRRGGDGLSILRHEFLHLVDHYALSSDEREFLYGCARRATRIESPYWDGPRRSPPGSMSITAGCGMRACRHRSARRP